MTDVLYVQGAGAGTYDDWDSALVASLTRHLGDGYVVHYPRMPDEADPQYAAWATAMGHDLDRLDAPVVVGHSVGGAILVNALAERPSDRGPRAVVLLAAPFLGDGGWPAEGFAPIRDLGSTLPEAVHVVHGLADDIVPPSHADLYARAIPQAQVHWLAGRDHQLNDDLGEVAAVIRLTA
jgi:hypothetical protein